MPDYTVRDRESGRTVTFRWNGSEPPTEADLDLVFADARRMPPSTPADDSASALDRLLGLLPMAGGIAGGVIGGIGGTVGGLGVGGVPGAIGGATLGGGFGEAARQLATRAMGGDAPASPLDAAKDIALQGGVQGVSEAVGGAVTKGAVKGAQAVYRGYLKPSLAARELPKANQIVKTALDEALPISRAGQGKVQGLTQELRAEVDRILAATPGEIDLKQLADRVRAFAKKRYLRAGKPVEDYQAALRVAENLDAHPSLMRPGPPVAREVTSPIVDASGSPIKRTELVPGPPQPQTRVSLSEANRIKRGIDESVGESNFGVERGATKTTQKVARHTTRKVLESRAPAIAPLNARESKLIDASKAIARAVEREANQNKLYGVKTLFAGGIGANEYRRGDDAGLALAKAATLRAGLTPGAQSWAAIVANRIAKELGVSAATAARLAAYAMSEPEQQAQE